MIERAFRAVVACVAAAAPLTGAACCEHAAWKGWPAWLRARAAPSPPAPVPPPRPPTPRPPRSHHHQHRPAYMLRSAGGMPIGMPMAGASAQSLIHGGGQVGSGALGHSVAANSMLSPAGQGGVLDHSQVSQQLPSSV